MKWYAYLAVLSILALLVIGCAPIQESHVIGSQPVKAEPAAQEEVVEPEPAAPEPEPEPEAEEEPSMSFEDEEAKAIAVAKDWLDTLEGFKDQKGRDVQIKNTVKTGCEGCWIVELTFVRTDKYFPDKTEKIRVNLKLKDWNMDSYTFG
jgi:hypothetical protein